MVGPGCRRPGSSVTATVSRRIWGCWQRQRSAAVALLVDREDAGAQRAIVALDAPELVDAARLKRWQLCDEHGLACWCAQKSFRCRCCRLTSERLRLQQYALQPAPARRYRFERAACAPSSARVWVSSPRRLDRLRPADRRRHSRRSGRPPSAQQPAAHTALAVASARCAACGRSRSRAHAGAARPAVLPRAGHRAAYRRWRAARPA